MGTAGACLLCAGALALTAGAEGDRSEAWVEIQAPRPGETVRRPLALVEVRGQVGAGARGSFDLVIGLDMSESTLHASGLDVDGDGLTGRMRRSPRYPTEIPFERWTTDSGDTIVQAELAFARDLLGALDPSRTRVGVLTFSGKAECRAKLGTPAAALEALDGVAEGIREDWTGSNLGGAVREGLRVLEEAPAARGPRRRRALVLLSDGVPTAPRSEPYARRLARRAALEARERSVAIYAVAVGEAAVEAPGFLAELAALGRGRWLPASRQVDLLGALPSSNAPRVQGIEVANRTTRQAARALRLFEDGSFDGFVPLSPGENTIEVRIREGAAATLTVYYEDVAEASPAQLDEVTHLRAVLRERTVETELAARAGRRVLERRLELEPE